MRIISFTIILFLIFNTTAKKINIRKTKNPKIVQTILDNIFAKSSASHPLSPISLDPVFSYSGPSPQRELKIAKG